MIITAMMAGFDPNAQETFNKLYWYTKAYPSSLTPHLMSWEIHANSIPGQPTDDSAFDGDADIALCSALGENGDAFADRLLDGSF